MPTRSKNRSSRATFFVLAFCACGDDSANQEPVDASLDAGRDAASVGFVDAAAIFPDAGAGAIARALETAGRDVSAERAAIVFRLSCERIVACKLDSSVTKVDSCTAERRARWDEGKQLGYTESCLDSALDVSACVAVHSCSELSADTTSCDGLVDLNVTLCGEASDAGR